MDSIIRQILELSGPMPDAAAHARYLETLTAAQLQARAAALVDGARQIRDKDRPLVEFWRVDRQKTLELA